MEENRKLLLDTFQNHLFQSYHSYCETHQLPLTIDGFITYLIDREFIAQTKIKNYTIFKEFETEYPKCDFHKTNTVKRLALRFNISERGVWGVLGKRNSNAR